MGWLHGEIVQQKARKEKWNSAQLTTYEAIAKKNPAWNWEKSFGIGITFAPVLHRMEVRHKCIHKCCSQCRRSRSHCMTHLYISDEKSKLFFLRNIMHSPLHNSFGVFGKGITERFHAFLYFLQCMGVLEK